jgi:parvulin-like peptidyl-prolyl isomerase
MVTRLIRDFGRLALIAAVTAALAAPVSAQTEKAAAPKTAPAAKPKPKPKPKPKAAAKRSKESLVIDRVVAVINDVIVLESELGRRVIPLAAEMDDIKDDRERARRQKNLAGKVLDDMVNEELILGAAREAKLEVGAKEIDNAVEEIKKQNNVDDAGLAKALEMQGYTMTAYRGDVSKQILRMRAINVLVRPRVTVTDEDVRAAYDARSRRSGAVTKVKLHHVLIALPEKPSQQQIASAKKRASELIERVRGGADFASLTDQYSDDAATAGTGGELGWIERGSLPTEWEAIVFAMSKGEVRGPISGPSGLHVFFVSDLVQADQKPFDEVKESIRNDLYRREMDKETMQWLDELRKKAHVEVKL